MVQRKFVVCDYPSGFRFPGPSEQCLGSSEKRLWQLAKTASELERIEVILTGPQWDSAWVPKAKHFPLRLDRSTVDEFLSLHGTADYLFGGQEYFDKPDYTYAFHKVAKKLLSYQTHPYDFGGDVVFDGVATHLFCYSDEMMERYAKQSPHKLLLFHTEVGEDCRFYEHPEAYLIWLGRLDGEKAPHIAVRAAEILNMPIYLMGAPLRDDAYVHEYRQILQSPVVARTGLTFGAEKMEMMARASCGLYTLQRDYIEAGASVLGEILCSGVPLAGISWKGNDAVTEAVDRSEFGAVAVLDPETPDEEAAKRLAEVVTKSLSLDRRLVCRLAREKYDMRLLVSKMFDLADGKIG